MREHLNDFMKQVGGTSNKNAMSAASSRTINKKHKSLSGSAGNKSKKNTKFGIKSPKNLPSSTPDSAEEESVDNDLETSASGEDTEEKDAEEEENEDVEPEKEDRAEEEEQDEEKNPKKQQKQNKENEETLKESDEQQTENDEEAEEEDNGAETDEGSTVSSDLQGHNRKYSILSR